MSKPRTRINFPSLNMRQHLTEIAHVGELATDRAVSQMVSYCCANDPDLPLPEFTAAIDDKRYLFSVFHRLRGDPFGG